MIIHGNKQISELWYARKASEGGGAVRLTNIIRGAQVVFGILRPSFNRLTNATKAAILAAFGQTDGYAVIKATNAYLNALAATDPTKATALAGLINEDPMMVCSLGLQPQGVQMPIRWLVGDGTAYINSGLVNIDKDYTAKFQYHKRVVLGCRMDNTYMTYRSYYINGANSFRGDWFVGYTNQYYSFTENSIYDVEVRKGLLKVNDSIVYSGSVKSDICTTYPFYIMAFNNFGTAGGMSSESHLSKCIIEYNSEEILHLFPFIRQGANGMIDTITGTFYPNANTSGSFSIAYTLPDGTPWTPLNQTP